MGPLIVEMKFQEHMSKLYGQTDGQTSRNQYAHSTYCVVKFCFDAVPSSTDFRYGSLRITRMRAEITLKGCEEV